MDEHFLIPRWNKIRLTKYGYAKICKLISERDDERCVICRSRWGIHHHHVIFRSSFRDPGSDTLNNLVCVCWKCHDLYCHGVEEMKCQERLQKYLQSEQVKAWNEAHKEQAELIYKKYRR
jgi:hypothetical protein